MTNAKENVATYCKAQADINKVDKMYEDQKKTLNERIKTCRSLLTDELSSKNISCFEVFESEENDTDPIYFRLKQNLPNINLNIEDIVNVLSSINKVILRTHAEKHNNDLPKMTSHLIHAHAKDLREQNNTNDKQSLSISNSRERGFTKQNELVSNETMKIAKDLLHARKELSSLKQKASGQKKDLITAQKEVESNVKEALKMSDPKTMTSRVHMMHGDNEWVYYLRCKETEKTQAVGIRKILPMIETAVATTLDENGLSREYNDVSYNLSSHFWKGVCDKLVNEFEIANSEKKILSKLSLDRGAPRRKKTNDHKT